MPYQAYEQNQQMLLPPSLEELVPEKDMARVINKFVDQLPRGLLEEKFKHPKGAPSFHPRMMLKLILNGYCQKIYSCREIAKHTRQNVCFLWLAGMSQPSFNTINRFRSKYLSKALPEIFAGLVEMLLEKGYIKGEEYFLDGTKLEADANKFSYVWRKNMQRYKDKVMQRAREIIEEADRVNEEEQEKYGSQDYPETGENSDITLQDIEEAAQKLADRAREKQDKEDKKKLDKSARQLNKQAQKLKKYERQQQILGERNSYSRTDTDATFMRMKNDQLRAGYNVQAGTENGFVTGFSLTQNANDATSFIDHMQQRQAMGIQKPKRLVADAGYGSEENYAYLNSEKIDNYMKYPSWHREHVGKLKPYEKENFQYDKTTDTFTCPQGKPLVFTEEKEHTYKSGYTSTTRIYECKSCRRCPVKSLCTQSPYGRRIHHSPRLAKYRQKVLKNLSSKKGIELRKRRGPEVETVFADIKHNMKYTRMRLRGLTKCSADMAWLFICYNLRKLGGLWQTNKHSFNDKHHRKPFIKALKTTIFLCKTILTQKHKIPGYLYINKLFISKDTIY